jgi:hypothetical protein
MKLSLKGSALAFGILWGACIFLVGLGNLIWTGYGEALLDVARSIYPGYASSSGFWGVIVGTLYGFLDGVVGGFVLAWLYNRFAGGERSASLGDPVEATGKG